MKTVQELLIAICDDLQEYHNDTPITDMQIDVTTRLLELLKNFKVLYVDTDSVKCVPGYPEVRPDIYAPDLDDAEDKDKADALDDFDLGEIEKTIKQPLDRNTCKPFKPALMGIYKHASSGSSFQCIATNDVDGIYTMRSLKSPHWTFDAHGISIYNNYSIDWGYTTNGHFEKE